MNATGKLNRAVALAHCWPNTRNGHGAGYWDRELGKAGDALSKAAEAVGSRDVYAGDDGKVYVS